MPYYLLQSLLKMAVGFRKTSNKERSMYHHGLIQILVQYQLQQQGHVWIIFLLEHGFIDEIEDIPSPMEREQLTSPSPSPSKRITRSMKENQKQQEDNEEERRQRAPYFHIIVRKIKKKFKFINWH